MATRPKPHLHLPVSDPEQLSYRLIQDDNTLENVAVQLSNGMIVSGTGRKHSITNTAQSQANGEPYSVSGNVLNEARTAVKRQTQSKQNVLTKCRCCIEKNAMCNCNQQQSSSEQLPLIDIRHCQYLDKIGEGSSSTVYRAVYAPSHTMSSNSSKSCNFTPLSPGALVAIKQVSIHDKEKRHQIVKEIETLLTVSSDYLVRFYGVNYHDDHINIAIEYMNRGCLADVLMTKKSIPEVYVSYLARCMLLALRTLHSFHLVHRDLKPANICLSREGDCKLSDFGITSQLDSTLAQCITFIGSYLYMSPERMLGRPYGYAADIWAMGLICLECVTGKFPYSSEGSYLDLVQTIAHGPLPLPPIDASLEFQSFLEFCINKDPIKRCTPEQLLQHPFITRSKFKAISKEIFADWLESQSLCNS